MGNTARHTDGVRLQERMTATIAQRELAGPDTCVLLMVSGGSDSTALAYLARDLRDAGALGPLAMLHVNHCLRGAAADADEAFVRMLAQMLDIPLTVRCVDVRALSQQEGGNEEAVGRRERYRAADAALTDLCRRAAMPLVQGRIFTAHTADDRVENFYMRSIVGTGPGGFRAMRYRTGSVARPLLDVQREELRDYLHERQRAGMAVVCDDQGNLWREDATNAHTDRFRAYVRHAMVPPARERNPQLAAVLCRTMNLIADEDDFMERLAQERAEALTTWDGDVCVLSPALGTEPLPLVRRVVVGVLQRMLGRDARVAFASVDAVCAAWRLVGQPEAVPVSGYVTNIQGDVAVSANKRGVRIEPMEAYRARRKRR